ncbi:MAG: hypothetical protein IKW78_05970 [Prevotella sp.]|nr:hypothetical protein [Prevotella sp.]MBR6016454.1 hypothetical protein [Prevotella sp.]
MKKTIFFLLTLIGFSVSGSAQVFTINDTEVLVSESEITAVVKMYVTGADKMTSMHAEFDDPSGKIRVTNATPIPEWTSMFSCGDLGISGISTTANAYSGDGAFVALTLTIAEGTPLGTYPIRIHTARLNGNDVAETTFNVKVVERLHFDEQATELPSFTAGTKAKVSMNRTIKANQWSTITLPFTLTKAKAEEVFGSDVQLAEFSGFTVDYGDDDENVTPLGITVNFSTYTMGTKKPMTGGKTFLIKTSSEITSFEADDCTLVATVTDTEKTDEFATAGKFTGSFVKTKVPADGLFIADNQFWYSTGETNIKAFRGWFELGAVLDKETDFGAKIGFMIDDIPTSIDGLGVARRQGDVYTLDGLYVGRDIPTNKLRKGIYIVNGNKVVVK